MDQIFSDGGVKKDNFNTKMRKIIKILLVGVVTLGLAAVSFPQTGYAAEVEAKLPAPTIYSPVNNYQTTDRSLQITGVTFNNTRIAVYIDDTFNGYATVREDASGVGSWSYRPFLPLKPGRHNVFTRAESLTNEKRSEITAKVSFAVVEEYPAPTLYQPVVDNQTTYDKPIIVGLAKNDSKIEVYIDGEYKDEFLVENHESGVASFKYQPKKSLNFGKHQVEAIAVDKSGKVSTKSLSINFEVQRLESLNVVPTTIEKDDATEEEVDENEKIEEENKDEEPTKEEAEEVGMTEDVTEEDGEESGTSKQVLGWGILGALLIGIVYQRRNTIARVFKKKDNISNKGDSNVQVITKEKKDGNSWEPRQDSQDKKKEDKDDNIPPPSPPPPASHY